MIDEITSSKSDGVGLIDEITSAKSDGVGLIDEIPKYSHYLCFSVSVRTNKFALKHLDRYSPEQEEVFQKIKSLHDSGKGYGTIAKLLMDEIHQEQKCWNYNELDVKKKR